MCLFSGPVRHVSGTRIYAGPRDAGRSEYQRIAYQMTVDVPDSLAMVLPIPTPPNPAEDAVQFVDASSCPTFFDDLDVLFPRERSASVGGLASRGGFAAPQTLVVHDVGEFEASFVPSLRDFARLDARFRMPDDVWSQLPQYADWSFCVFKLRPVVLPPPPDRGFWKYFTPDPEPPPAPPRKHHPMAFDFPRRDPNQLFFPTVHVHDGAVHRTADFDHTLYAQLDADLDEPALPKRWEAAVRPTEHLAPRAKGFVRPERPMIRRRIEGTHPNGDITI